MSHAPTVTQKAKLIAAIADMQAAADALERRTDTALMADKLRADINALSHPGLQPPPALSGAVLVIPAIEIVQALLAAYSVKEAAQLVGKLAKNWHAKLAPFDTVAQPPAPPPPGKKPTQPPLDSKGIPDAVGSARHLLNLAKAFCVGLIGGGVATTAATVATGSVPNWLLIAGGLYALSRK